MATQKSAGQEAREQRNKRRWRDKRRRCWQGMGDVRRGDTTLSQIRGARAAEQEATARQEEKAVAPSDLSPGPSPPGDEASRWDMAA
jgi:hypothetical protein